MKRVLSLLLSLALLLSCIGGITLFAVADELPAPFGYFSFTGNKGKVENDIGVVRYILVSETNTNLPNGVAIGDTGLYGYTVDTEGYGLYFGGNLFTGVPAETSVTFAVEYYIDSETALTGNLMQVTNARSGVATFANLPVQQKGVALYTLPAADVAAIGNGDTRLRVRLYGEAVNKLYITGIKMLDTQYAGVTANCTYYDFGAVGTCPYYPETFVAQSAGLTWADAEIDSPAGFEGYRYFSLNANTAAYAQSAEENKPVYIKVYTTEGNENTTLDINTFQVYGPKKNDTSVMQSTHNANLSGFPSPSITVADGVGAVLMPATNFRNGAGPGSFRFLRSVGQKIARIEIYDVATYCSTAGADAEIVEAMHAWMVQAQWGVTAEGYQAPTLDQDGYTGTVVCDNCGKTLAEGEPIPSSVVYAQFDFTSGVAVSTAIKNLSVTNSDQVNIQKIPNSDDYAMAILQHNAAIKFAIDAERLAIDEEDILNGTKLAVTVEYYMSAAHDDNARIGFETANSRMMALYKNFTGTTWDAVCLNDGAALAANKTAIATFIVGDGVFYTAEKGQFGGNDKFETPREIETLTAAKNLVNGYEFFLYGWGNKMSGENPIYIKSITMFDASELEGDEGGEGDGSYYVDFEGTASNPYYPQYVSQANNGLSIGYDTVEWYDQDTEKQYPRFNYMYIGMPSALLTNYDNFKATPVKLVIERKEGSEVDGMIFQYQRDRSDADNSARWSGSVTVNFDENGRYETLLLDATFMNGLNAGSSIRMRDEHYVQAGNAEEGFTYELNAADDLAGIASIRVYPLAEKCAEYHDVFTEANRNLVWQGRVEPTYEQPGYSGDLVCTHCGELFSEGEPLDVLGAYAKLDFSDGTLVQTAIGGFRPIDDKTSITPVQIPGTDSYGLKLVNHNSGVAIKFSEFDRFTLQDIEDGREIAISVEYYVPAAASTSTRIVFDPQKGANKIMALYTDYGGRTWDSAVLNAGASMVRDQLNVATFTIGKNVDYVTGPGQFSAANPFDGTVTVNTTEFAQALVDGGEIILRGWSVNPATADDPSTPEKDETAPERAVYIKSITVYDAKDVNVQEIDTSMEFIDYTSEFVSSPVYYPQYVQYGGAYGITGAQVTEQGSVETGDDVTYVYFGVTDALKSSEEEVKPVAIRFYFKEGVTREEIQFAYQTAAPWQYITLDIVDGVAEAVLEDAAFTNGLNGKGSFRISNYSTDPIVDDIARIELFVIKDNTALVELLEQADEIVKFKTPASVAAYMAVAEEAQAVADSAWSTEEEIAAAVAALEAAAEALVDCDHACGTEIVDYVAETCLTVGYTGDAACKDCGYVAPEGVGTEIPAHETELINVKEASCKETGNTGDLWCTVCEKIAKPGNVLNKLPHAWNEGEVTKEATATEYGEFTKTCTVCGETLVTRLEFEAQLGDVDGDGAVNSTDARLVLQFAVKKIVPTALDLEVADVDGSGKVDSTDARLILQYSVKKITVFPAA